MSTGSIGEHRLTRALVTVPAWGVPYLDVETDGEAEIAGRQTVKLADLSIVATVVSGGPAEGKARYRLACGAGGWGNELSPKGHQDRNGVKRQTLITDAAQACGETVSGTTTERVGPHYARDRAPASSVLPARQWYVGFDGITYLGQRPASEYTGDATNSRTDRAAGVVELLTESLTGLVPGASVNGMTAVDVEYELDAKRLVARVYGAPSGASGRLEAMRKIVASLFPTLRFQGTYEFRVVSQAGERLNLQPVRASSGMPDLTQVPVRLPPGVRANFLPGSMVLVTFVDALASRPVVVAGDAPDAPGWMPLTLEFGGPGALGVARIGDTVQAGPFAGVITSGSLRVKAVV